MNLISVADLLPRRERALDWRAVARWLDGKRVVVTGAGGFIGSELSRQLRAFPTAGVMLIDNCEHGLYQVARTCWEARSCFGDVRDRWRMADLLHEADVVFHAAAMKHVPICEVDPLEAEKTNVVGTENVLRAAPHAHVVLVSTDKAVRPSSVMGKSKAAAEALCRATGRASVVRFGNVIGSSGSVVPLWMEQIAAGGPVTITDRRMTRYMMTVGEAAELILQAAAYGVGIFVLDMGTPVSMMTLAEEMIRLSGRRGVEIVETGMRAGEKLEEELSEGALVETGVEGLRRVAE